MSSTIRLVSYNILSDCYVRVPGQPWNAFEYCSNEDILWENRCPKILTKLLSSNADVICLQEVTFELHNDIWELPYWLNDLISNGYTAIMQKMTQKEWSKNADRNLRMVGRREPTGIVTLFKNNTFEEIIESQHGSGSGIVLYLKLKQFDNENQTNNIVFAINNIHLVGDPSKFEAHEKQLNSAYKNLKSGEKKIIELNQKNNNNNNNNYIYEFICGDFNGNVLIESNDLNINIAESKELSNNENKSQFTITNWFLSNGFQRVPIGSTWANNEIISRLDHIMYNTKNYENYSLIIKEYFPFNDDTALETLPHGLPNIVQPSDHLMIQVDFDLIHQTL